ncbi:MAG: glycosyltransferase family 9 protein, partial [Bacteroidetes bacterium]|nr:glycosyltransferase family 9 protein [Bacteroidota bacterium]
LISKLSGAKFTIGFYKADFSFLYKKIVPYISSNHEVQGNLALIMENSDDKNGKELPRLKIPVEVREKVFSFLANLTDKKIIAIAPGSVWKTKIYPRENFILLIKSLLKNNYFVMLIGGNEDNEICTSIENEFGKDVKSAAGNFSVIESVELLKKCDALISNDSAPTHLGMIADIPVLTIFCSTIPEFGFYPYNERSKYISLEGLDCKPCGIHGHQICPIKTFICGKNLTDEAVFNKLEEILSA